MRVFQHDQHRIAVADRAMISTISASVDALRCAGGSAIGALFGHRDRQQLGQQWQRGGTRDVPAPQQRAEFFGAYIRRIGGSKAAARVRYWITG